MNLLATILTFFETKFAFLFTAVSGAFNVIISEIPDDEIAILHGAMTTAANSLKTGRTAEEAYTDVLNYIQQSEKKEISKLGDQLLQAFITATAPATPAA